VKGVVHKPDTVIVTGTGVIRATPDVAVLRLGVEVRHSALRAAYSGAASAASHVLDGASSAGVPRADITTSGLSLRSETVWREDAGQQVVAYVASTGLTVAVRDLPRMPEVLDAVVLAAGDALRVHGLSLEVSDPAAAAAAAQEAAFDDARASAERLAQRAGRRLGGVVRIEAAHFSAPGPPMPLARAALAGAVESMPVEAGEAEISASVSVTWRLGA
jgi:hypothetical protein